MQESPTELKSKEVQEAVKILTDNGYFVFNLRLELLSVSDAKNGVRYYTQERVWAQEKELQINADILITHV